MDEASAADRHDEQDFDEIVGPIWLPLDSEAGVLRFGLTYFEYQGERWAAAVLGDLGGSEPAPLRIESACFFGHVMGSRQCDCGYQLHEAFRQIGLRGRGLVIYAIDQDARGLGIKSHFKIYRYRQHEELDTPEVFERLGAPLDNRSYEAVPRILRHLGAGPILLMSNNPERLRFLEENGVDVRREPLEAPLDSFNMATLMLEKEDLGYQWSFRTHGDWLRIVQDRVGADIDARSALIVRDNQSPVAQWTGRDWDVADHLLRDGDASGPGLIVYLSDLPRLDEIDLYARTGAKFIVVPFASFPEALSSRAAERGVKLQDWGRSNRYDYARPQWLPAKDAELTGAYQRNGEIRRVGGQ